MGERRKQSRIRQRLRVMFRNGPRQETGLTTNIGRGGFSIQSTLLIPAGARAEGWLKLNDGKQVAFVAQVRWTRKVAGADAARGQHLMGVAFVVPPPAEYTKY